MNSMTVRVAALLVTGILLTDACAAADLFADKNLESAIRKELKKKDADPLKEEDLKNVYFLHANGAKIQKLDGVERCVNLAEIKLSDNEIADLKPLAGLKNCQSLYLANNKITDLAPLKEWVKLQHLELQGNEIESLEPLKGLTAMASLYLSRNKIKDVAPLAEMKKLSSLALDGNALEEIAPLGKLAWLRTLNLKWNQIENVKALAPLTELSFTMLQGNKLTDLSPLVEMAKKDAAGPKRFAPYWNLYLADNPLSDAGKAQVEELKKIGVRVNVELK